MTQKTARSFIFSNEESLFVDFIKDLPVSNDQFWKHQDWLAAMRSQQQKIFVGLDENQKIITAVVWQMLDPETVEILSVATRHQYQKQGWMTYTLGEHLLFLKQSFPCLQNVWLEVHEHNLIAQKLYMDLGWDLVGLRSNYYKDQASALLFSRKMR